MKYALEVLKQRIEHDIDRVGGIEGFNQCSYAPELIVGWIDDLIKILEGTKNAKH